MITPQFDFDICQRLKAAGLPQPNPVDGQIWYNSKGVAAMVYAVGYGKIGLQLANSGMMIPFKKNSLRKAVYCPTTDDLKAFFGLKTLKL
jgi:hypothetical protein